MSDEPHAAGRIVVGVDGSACSLTALDWAVRQATLTGSRLEPTTAWEWPNTLGMAYAYFPDNYDPSADARAILDQAIEKITSVSPTLDVRPVVTEGQAAPILVDASRGAELLVVGSRGHGGFAGMVIGSVSQHCVTHAHCPVVVVRGR